MLNPYTTQYAYSAQQQRHQQQQSRGDGGAVPLPHQQLHAAARQEGAAGAAAEGLGSPRAGASVDGQAVGRLQIEHGRAGSLRGGELAAKPGALVLSVGC